MHKINFSVPLTGSHLFDVNAIVTAKKLCTKFPPLNYDISEDHKSIVIHGELNDWWFEHWNQAVFQLGNFDFEVEEH